MNKIWVLWLSFSLLILLTFVLFQLWSFFYSSWLHYCLYCLRVYYNYYLFDHHHIDPPSSSCSLEWNPLPLTLKHVIFVTATVSMNQSTWRWTWRVCLSLSDMLLGMRDRNHQKSQPIFGSIPVGFHYAVEITNWHFVKSRWPHIQRYRTNAITAIPTIGNFNSVLHRHQTKGVKKWKAKSFVLGFRRSEVASIIIHHQPLFRNRKVS